MRIVTQNCFILTGGKKGVAGLARYVLVTKEANKIEEWESWGIPTWVDLPRGSHNWWAIIPSDGLNLLQ